jgi:pantothenate kinase
VAMIFARNIDSSLTSLVKKIDAATKENSSAKMGSFVVFLANDDDAKKMETSLPEFAKKENIKSLVLAIDNVAGPQGYNIAKDADITVVLYNKRTVKANHVFRKGELNDKAIEAIVKDIPKILEKEEKK